MKEWRSKKQLEEYLMEKPRNEIIGYVTYKALKKWNEEIDWRGNDNEEDMFILQKGNKYYYLTYRK